MSKILIVDDEPSVASAFREMLDGEGYEVLSAGRADAALSLLERESPHLIVLDVCMPGMSGLEALDAVKMRHPLLPVIVMSGQGTMNTAIEATKRGAFDYHLKPFEPEAMLQTIRQA